MHAEASKSQSPVTIHIALLPTSRGPCWCIVLGPEKSHPTPIRNGLYGPDVDAATVMTEVKGLMGGRVKVQLVRE